MKKSGGDRECYVGERHQQIIGLDGGCNYRRAPARRERQTVTSLTATTVESNFVLNLYIKSRKYT